ncbi:hypothetical protein FACS189494_03020 [Spirochaetia bacterium]|nr:hypothetical protein FACS189494_03020 [Spirochaetia bacterium]
MDTEKEMLGCFRQLTAENQALMLNFVRVAGITENPTEKAIFSGMPNLIGKGVHEAKHPEKSSKNRNFR